MHFLCGDVVQSVKTASDEAFTRLMALCKLRGLLSGNLRPLPWEKDMVEGIPEEPTFKYEEVDEVLRCVRAIACPTSEGDICLE